MVDVSETMEIAVQHHQAGRLQQAQELYRLVLQSYPNHPVILHSLGMIAYQTGRYDMALGLVTEAIANNSQVPQFHNTLGVIFEALGKLEEAIDTYQQAVSLKPDYAEALAPGYAQAYNTAGFSLEKQGKFAEAIESYSQAVQLAPDFAEAYNHLGVVLNAMGRYEEAIANYRQAVRIEPDYAEAHWNQSLALLLTGRLTEGWKEYEWRRNPDLEMITYPHHYQMPRGDGSSFNGKRLLVHYEQGFGDTLQFVRYLPMVKARGGTVILEVRKPLIRLLRRFPGVDELAEASFDQEPAVKFDLYTSLMDLPRIFGTTLETIPAEVPYIHTETRKAAYWRDRLSGSDFKVGIVWSGSTMYERNYIRSCTLERFASLAGIGGVKLYGLQKGPAGAQVRESAGKIGVVNLGEQFQDFTDTAAAIENLDLVVSVDTAVLHLAGAMGKPVWALLCSAPAWQWMLDRQDSPWYPTMLLFRQRNAGHWDDVFQRVAEQLQILTRKKLKNRKPP